MNKIYWDNFGIEVTRKCNMSCAHCMRGDAQNKDINLDWVDEVLRNTAFIGKIHFTGGEPTLNWKAIKETLKIAKKYNIPILYFDVVTNGKNISDEFVKTAIEWYNYCKNYNKRQDIPIQVLLTIDDFHSFISNEDINKLKKIPCFDTRITDFKNKINFSSIYNTDKVLNLGRAKKLQGYEKVYSSSLHFPYKIYKYNNNFYLMQHFLLTCNGNIVDNSDYEYNDEKEIIFCNYKNLLNAINSKAIISKTGDDFDFFKWIKG